MKSKYRGVCRIVSVFLCLLLSTIIVSSCIYLKYGGEHSDLYTVAVNNVFGIFGYRSNGEVCYDPSIKIIETDDYGRVLFFYNEYYDDSIEPQIDYGMAFVIMQKTDSNYVYYYQDDCYVPYFDTVDEYDEILKRVDSNLIDELKELNDWNKVLNESKCEKTKISNKKSNGKLHMNDYEFDEIIYPYAKANGYQGTDQRTCKFFEFCNSDANGKELYYVYCMSSDTDENGKKIYDTYVYAIIVNADKTFSDTPIVEIVDPSTSYDLIKALKQQNNWSY